MDDDAVKTGAVRSTQQSTKPSTQRGTYAARAAANFEADLKMGKLAEKEFLGIHPWALTQSKDRKADFIGPKGERIELKTDTYDPKKTPNMFLERWSSVEAGKPGGPWQSLEGGSNVFIYWFPKGNFWLECRNLKNLVDYLDLLLTIKESPAKQVDVPNEGPPPYVTRGYAIPRKLLKRYFDIYFY